MTAKEFIKKAIERGFTNVQITEKTSVKKLIHTKMIIVLFIQ